MTKEQEKISNIIEEKGPITVAEISKQAFLSRQMIHRHLKKLLEKGVISKSGQSPKVFYSKSPIVFSVHKSGEKKEESVDFQGIDDQTKKILDENFLFINPNGQKEEGVLGFIFWCEIRGFDVIEKAKEYIKIFHKYENLRENGVFDGTEKLKGSFAKVCADKVVYLDFYAWEVFGKTKLGQLLLYAKQSQDRKLINTLVNNIKDKILNFIEKEKIDVVGFIPPTVKRGVQFMKVLEEGLGLSLPKINLVKIKTEILIPQKTLTRLEDRIQNADTTIFVDDNRRFKKVLLIDDAVGSGATLNQVACKIKSKGISNEVLGLSITGSIKGFDVISEV